MSLPAIVSDNIKSSLKELTRNVAYALREDERIKEKFRFKVTAVQDAFANEFDVFNFSSLSVHYAYKLESFNFYQWITEDKAKRIFRKALPESLYGYDMDAMMARVSEGLSQYMDNNRPEEEMHSFELALLHEMANLDRDEKYAYKGDELPDEFCIDAKNPLLKKASIDGYGEGDMFKVSVGSQKKTYTITEVFSHIYTGKKTWRIERGIITAGGNGRFAMMD